MTVEQVANFSFIRLSYKYMRFAENKQEIFNLQAYIFYVHILFNLFLKGLIN